MRPSAPVSAAVDPVPTEREGEVSVSVDAARSTGPVQRPWRRIIGSEHLALLLRGEGPGGLDVGEDLAPAFRIVRDELGVEAVRAHAILHDVLGVYREDADGSPRYDFDKVDLVIDRLLATGLRPVVELSFMPEALAADPEPRVFDYIGLISPPRDLGALGGSGRGAGSPSRRRGTASTRSSAGASRSGTRRTSRSSGPVARATTSTSTTRPPGP